LLAQAVDRTRANRPDHFKLFVDVVVVSMCGARYLLVTLDRDEAIRLRGGVNRLIVDWGWYPIALLQRSQRWQREG
jgi:hypothetical protein